MLRPLMAQEGDVARILADTEHVRVVYDPRDRDTVVITFSQMDFDRVGEAYYGERVFTKLGFSVLGVVAKANNWFPAVAMRRVLRTIDLGVVGAHRRRVAYGSSMGAYGALKWGRALGAGAVLAMAPQASIVPALARDDRRYRDLYDPSMHRFATVFPWNVGPRSFVFYDPYQRLDSHHARLLRWISRSIQTVPMWHMGHEPIFALDSGGLSEMIHASHDGTVAEVRALASRLRRRSARRAMGLCEALMSRRPGFAEAIYLRHRSTASPFLKVEWDGLMSVLRDATT
jgi:hypothetical protein